METALLLIDYLLEAGVPIKDIAYMALLSCIVVLLYKGNVQNKKNGYLKTEEFHEFEKKYIEENEKYLTKDDFNEFKEAHDSVHKDIGDRLVKVEIILEKVVESLKELKDDVKKLMTKGK